MPREQGCLVAARTYRAWRRGRLPSRRTVSDAVITDAIRATAGRHPQNSSTGAAKRPIICGEPLPSRILHRGQAQAEIWDEPIRCGKAVRTTIPAKDTDRPGDLLNLPVLGRGTQPGLRGRLLLCA